MEIKLLSCPLCSEAHFQNVSVLRNALVEATKKEIQCPVCDEVILGLDKFTIHLFTHCILENEPNRQDVPAETEHANPEEQHAAQAEPSTEDAQDVRCDICNFSFSDAGILEMHRNLLHTNGFSCHLCHKKFKMQGSLMVHMRVAHYGFGASDFKSKVPSETPPDKQEDARAPAKAHESNKQWECDVCLKKFTTKYFLKKHKRLHTGEMPYVCNLCNKSFTFQQSYHKHMLYHSSDKPHVCSECGRAFKELSTLHNHFRIHSGERPFACETCGKNFRQRVSYLVHRRIHTGAMPYKCTSCDKQFRYKVSQRTHKCKAQPPGAVVRHFGDLVQRLLQQRTPEVQSAQPAPEEPCKDVSKSSEITNNDFFGFDMSPTFQTSEQLENLCLSNKEMDNQIYNGIRNETRSTEEYSTINEECFRQLLYNSNH